MQIPRDIYDLIPKGVGTAFLTFTGTIITVIVTWAKDRNIDAKSVQITDLATKYMLFWDQRLKALLAAGYDSNAVEARKKEAILHIDGAAKFLIARLDKLQGRTDIRERPTNFFLRTFMLYKPNRKFSWVPRSVFYLYAFGGLLGGVGFILAKVFAPINEIGWAATFGVAIAYPILCYLFAWPARLIAEWYDRKAVKRIFLEPLPS